MKMVYSGSLVVFILLECLVHYRFNVWIMHFMPFMSAISEYAAYVYGSDAFNLSASWTTIPSMVFIGVLPLSPLKDISLIISTTWKKFLIFSGYKI
jgi:hypothetical protein